MNIKYKKTLAEISELLNVNESNSKKIIKKLLENKEKHNIVNLINKIYSFEYCSKCNLIKEIDRDCDNCSLETNKLMIVLNMDEYIKVNEIFRGTKYFSLNTTNNRKLIEKINNNNFEQLLEYIDYNNISDVTVAMSPSNEQQLFSKILKKSTQENLDKKIKIYGPNIGMSYGSILNYTNEDTIKEALNKREEI